MIDHIPISRLVTLACHFSVKHDLWVKLNFLCSQVCCMYVFVTFIYLRSCDSTGAYVFWATLRLSKSFLSGLTIKNPPAMQELQEMWVRSLGQEDTLKEHMATYSSIPTQRISWTEESDRLQSIGSKKVAHG